MRNKQRLVYTPLKVQYGNSNIMSQYWPITINIQLNWRHGIDIFLIVYDQKEG